MSFGLITSLLDTDLYKFTMMQCVWHNFRSASVKYRFKTRKFVDLAPLFYEIGAEIANMCDLKLSNDELKYLNSTGIFHSDFLLMLKEFKLNFKHVNVFVLDNELHIEIYGLWFETILFEVPILAIVSELYYRKHGDCSHDLLIGRFKLSNKISLVKKYISLSNNDALNKFHFSDFGTRRRYSKDWQQEVVSILQKELPYNFMGTSNILLAYKFGLTPIGTMAHEYLQACQVLAPTLRESQSFALHVWLLEYPDRLKIALTDVIGMDAFLADFSTELAHKYTGLRHDSSSPVIWADKALSHYNKLGIDAKDKVLVFSDGLDFNKALWLYSLYHDKVKVMFGIGTNLTNDLGVSNIQIVLKMVECNDKPVAKLSDEISKSSMDNLAYVTRLKNTFNKI